MNESHEQNFNNLTETIIITVNIVNVNGFRDQAISVFNAFTGGYAKEFAD